MPIYLKRGNLYLNEKYWTTTVRRLIFAGCRRSSSDFISEKTERTNMKSNTESLRFSLSQKIVSKSAENVLLIYFARIAKVYNTPTYGGNT